MIATADRPSLFDDEDVARASAIVDSARQRGWMLASAESCTGGLVAALLTEVSGASDVVDCGFVTYSNAAKTRLLDVSPALLAQVGAVSAETARAMAEGARAGSRADCAVSITGIAGPGGGSPLKPVGLVHFGIAAAGLPTRVLECRFEDRGRSAVRLAALRQALSLFEQALGLADPVC